MKKTALPLLVSSLLVSLTDGEAFCCCDGTNFYAKAFGGANFLQNTSVEGNQTTYQTGYIAGGSLGYSWHYGLNLEAEYAFRRNAISKTYYVQEGSSTDGHFQTSSYMANLLWDFPCEWTFRNFQPFIGAGVGYDVERMHSSNSRVVFNQKWNEFSWQLMAGLAYPILCNTELTLEYKYHQGGHFNHHSLGVGLIYNFAFLR